MKQRYIKIYHYDKLKTEDAKNKAREWWINAELNNPAWQEEHFKSMENAINEAKKNKHFKSLKSKSEKALFTGYCADCLLNDLMKRLKRIPTETEIENSYCNEWDNEINERIQDIKYIEENLIINEYDFLEDGRIL